MQDLVPQVGAKIDLALDTERVCEAWPNSVDPQAPRKQTCISVEMISPSKGSRTAKILRPLPYPCTFQLSRCKIVCSLYTCDVDYLQ